MQELAKGNQACEGLQVLRPQLRLTSRGNRHAIHANTPIIMKLHSPTYNYKVCLATSNCITNSPKYTGTLLLYLVYLLIVHQCCELACMLRSYLKCPHSSSPDHFLLGYREYLLQTTVSGTIIGRTRLRNCLELEHYGAARAFPIPVT